MEPLAPLVSAFYYTMIGAGILLAIAAVLALFTYLVRVPILSAITDFINNEILGVLIGADNVMPSWPRQWLCYRHSGHGRVGREGGW